MRLSQHFELKEFCVSDKANEIGFDNNPDIKECLNLSLLVSNVMQPLRVGIQTPIYITSGFRNILINYLIRGSKTSDHTLGCACDFKCKDITSAFNYILEYLDFDQLIWEFGDDDAPAWIHVSYKYTGNRKEVLRAIKENGKTKYIPYVESA